MNWMMSLINHIPALPEVLLLVGTCVVMIADLRVKSERRTGTFWQSPRRFVSFVRCAQSRLFD